MHFNFLLRTALNLCLWTGVFATFSHAETPSQIPNPLRARRAWVADEAQVIDAATEAKINASITRFERKNGAEIAVVTVHNLGELSVEKFALQLAKLWHVGKKARNNGVLILVAVDDRKARIEVGLGLETLIPDAAANQILQTQMLAQFRGGNYGGGLFNGVEALEKRILNCNLKSHGLMP